MPNDNNVEIGVKIPQVQGTENVRKLGAEFKDTAKEISKADVAIDALNSRLKELSGGSQGAYSAFGALKGIIEGTIEATQEVRDAAADIGPKISASLKTVADGYKKIQEASAKTASDLEREIALRSRVLDLEAKAGSFRTRQERLGGARGVVESRGGELRTQRDKDFLNTLSIQADKEQKRIIADLQQEKSLRRELLELEAKQGGFKSRGERSTAANTIASEQSLKNPANRDYQNTLTIQAANEQRRIIADLEKEISLRSELLKLEAEQGIFASKRAKAEAATRIATERGIKNPANRDYVNSLNVSAQQEEERVRQRTQRETERTQAREDTQQQRQRRALGATALHPLLGNRGGVLTHAASTASTYLGGTGGYGLMGASDLLSNFGPVGIGAAAAVTGITVLSKSIYDLVKSEAEGERGLQNFADRLGLTITQARQMTIAANLLGMDMQTLETSGRVLSAVLEGDSGASKAGAEGLARLGIEARDLQGNIKDVGPVLVEVLEKLAKLPTLTERERTATELLGRGAAKSLQPVLASYQSAMDAAKHFADTLDGNVHSSLTAADLAIQELDQTVSALRKNLAAKFAPVVIDIVTSINGGPDRLQATQQRIDAIKSNPKLSNEQKQQQLRELKSDFDAGRPITSPDSGVGLEGRNTVSGIGSERIQRFDYSTSFSRQRDQDAVSFRSRRRITEDELREQLGEIRDHDDPNKDVHKEGLKQLEKKLQSPLSNRPEIAAQYAAKQSDETRVQAQLKALEASRNYATQITESLRHMHTEADAAEASLKGGSESAVARLKDEIQQLRQKGASLAQIREAQEQVNRVAEAGRQKDDRSVTANQERNQFGLAQQRLRGRITSEARRNRLFTGADSEDTADSISQSFSEASRLSTELRDQEIGRINKLGDKFGNSREQREAIDNAKVKAEGELINAQQQRDQALDTLRARDARKADNDKTSLSRGLAAQGRDENRKEFDSNSKAVEQIDRIQSKTRTGLEVPDVNSALQTRLQLARQVYQQDLDDISKRHEAGDYEKDSYREVLDLNKALIDLKSRERDAERDHLVEVIALTRHIKEDQDRSTRNAASGLFDAITQRDAGSALSQFFAGQAKDMGRNVLGNVATQLLPNGLGTDRLFGNQTKTGANGEQQLTGIGKILQGTPFGVNPDKVALANVDRQEHQESITATHDLTSALRELRSRLDQFVSGRAYPQSPGGGGISVGSSGANGASGINGISGINGLNGASGSGSSSLMIVPVPSASGASRTNTGATPVTFDELGNPVFGAGASSSDSGSKAGKAASSSLSSRISQGITAGGRVAGSIQSGSSAEQRAASVATTAPELLSAFGKFSKGAGSLAGGAANSLAAGDALQVALTGTNKTGGPVSGLGRAGAGVDIAAAATLGTLGVMNGIKTGGARGLLGAVGSGAGALAAVDPDPFSRGILQAVGLGSSLVRSFFGDPRKNFADKQTRDLQANRYLGTTTLNQEEDANGNVVSYNKFGLPTSTGLQNNFSYTLPRVDTYDANNTGKEYYDVPGSVSSSFQSGYKNPSAGQNAVTIQMQVYALDSSSILDRSDDIASALQKALVNGHSVANRISNTLFGGA